MKAWYRSAPLIALALASLAGGAARAQGDVSLPPFIDPALSKKAKVTVTQAEQIVLKKHPGKVADESIVVEDGILRWIIKVKRPNGESYETDVDAKTGKILEDTRSGLAKK